MESALESTVVSRVIWDDWTAHRFTDGPKHSDISMVPVWNFVQVDPMGQPFFLAKTRAFSWFLQQIRSNTRSPEELCLFRAVRAMKKHIFCTCSCCISVC